MAVVDIVYRQLFVRSFEQQATHKKYMRWKEQVKSRFYICIILFYRRQTRASRWNEYVRMSLWLKQKFKIYRYVFLSLFIILLKFTVYKLGGFGGIDSVLFAFLFAIMPCKCPDLSHCIFSSVRSLIDQMYLTWRQSMIVL